MNPRLNSQHVPTSPPVEIPWLTEGAAQRFVPTSQETKRAIARPPIVLFLCAGNSCRSQMAEAFLRDLAGDRFAAFSAGTRPGESVNPLAIDVMSEVGVDIRCQYPKSVSQFLGRLAVRHLIIVCDQAEQDCPRIFPGTLTRTVRAVSRSGRFLWIERFASGRFPPGKRPDRTARKVVGPGIQLGTENSIADCWHVLALGKTNSRVYRRRMPWTCVDNYPDWR